MTEVVEDGESLERALVHAARIASLPSLAVRVTKRVIDAMPEASRTAGLELERLAYGLLAQDPAADAAAETGPEAMSALVELTDEQLEIQRVCREFAAREIRPVSHEVDEADIEVPWELWRKASALGLTSFMLPAEYGGAGMTDCLTGCLVQEELSHGCAGHRQPDHLGRVSSPSRCWRSATRHRRSAGCAR